MTRAGPLTPVPPGPRQLGGRFELRAALGQGGFATVYRAWDATRQQEVALEAIGRS